MPGHAGSPYWAAVDFDSEGDDGLSPQNNNRMYVDPWDNDAYGMVQEMNTMQEENVNSLIGEPISASFYYVPTKNYESEEEASVRRKVTPPIDMVTPDYSLSTTGRRSRATIRDVSAEAAVYGYGYGPIRERRRSLYIEEPVYAPHPMLYEPLYGVLMPPPMNGYLPPPPRSRMSLQHNPEYAMAAYAYGKSRRHSRMTDSYDHYAYESLSPEYEDWARPFPKTAPDNFHLSRYGHLQIDYSCSWNSLDRLIRQQ